MHNSYPTCLVTGGGGGLGTAICQAMGRAGYHVVVVDIEEGRAARVAHVLQADGQSAQGLACDVADAASVDRLRDRVLSDRGGVDVLVNLAGTVRNDVMLKIRDEDFDATFATHVRGTLSTMRAFVPGMKERKSGRVINTSSVAARGSIGGASYGAAKSGIEGLSRAAAMELARHGVTINCIAPGLIATGLFLTTPEDFRNKAVAGIPMGRAGDPDDIAPAVVFLASEGARYITGQTLTICGGLTLGY